MLYEVITDVGVADLRDVHEPVDTFLDQTFCSCCGLALVVAVVSDHQLEFALVVDPTTLIDLLRRQQRTIASSLPKIRIPAGKTCHQAFV